MGVPLTAGEAIELLDRIAEVILAAREIPFDAEGGHAVRSAANSAQFSSMHLTHALRRAGIETPLLGTEAAR